MAAGTRLVNGPQQVPRNGQDSLECKSQPIHTSSQRNGGSDLSLTSMSSAEPDPDNNNADDNRDPKSERQVWIDVQRRLRRCRHEEHTHRDQDLLGIVSELYP